MVYGDYKILLSEKIKMVSITEVFDYIDAIQSFKGDWPLYLAPREGVESSTRVEMEGVTPLPATHGGFAFIEYYLDEDLASIEIAREIRVDTEVIRSALEKGVPLHRLVPEEVLDKLDRLGKFIKLFFFEAALPLVRELAPCELELVKRLHWVVEFEQVEVDAIGMDPARVELELERSYYVGEYLRRLEALFSGGGAKVTRLLLVRGEGDAGLTLKQLENVVDTLVHKIPVERLTVMYYRLIHPV
ncbi:MAG: hypothetical protein QW291_01000 [Thermofilaceae archaeon]